ALLGALGCSSILGIEEPQDGIRGVDAGQSGPSGAGGRGGGSTNEGGSSGGGTDADGAVAGGPSTPRDGCTADKATTCMGKCGQLTDACGARVDCGGCVAPATCGAILANVCDCVSNPVSTTCMGRCGIMARDNCNALISCGTCGCTSEPTATTCAGKC